MRVLMLSWEFPPEPAGGTAAHIDGLARAMVRAGHEVVLITRRTPSTGDGSDAGGVRVLRADVDMPWLPDGLLTRTASANHAFVAQLARLGDWRPEVVHAHNWGAAWAAHVAATLLDVPLVTTLHGTKRGRNGGHLPTGPPTDVNAVEWWLALRSTRVITSTKLMVREVIDGFELDPGVVHRIPNGVDPAWWAASGPEEAPDRVRSGRVLAWGRVRYEKGFQVLARAIGALRYRVIGLECTIAGRGSYLPELQSQIDIAGVGHLIELPGYLSDDQLRAAVHDAGCVVIPSLYEPFGVVALEALAGGAPLIVADTGGLAELVGGTGSALLFEPGNADELANCIERVLTEPQTAEEMVARGRRLLEASYSWDAIAARTVDVYADALSAGITCR